MNKLFFSIVGTGAAAADLATMRLGVPKGKTWILKEIRGKSTACANIVGRVQVNGEDSFTKYLSPQSLPVGVNESYSEGTEISLVLTLLVGAQVSGFLTIGVEEYA